MEKQIKIARFEGGPLDGDSIEMDAQLREYKSLKMVTTPVASRIEDAHAALEQQEVVYVENPIGSGNFICKD